MDTATAPTARAPWGIGLIGLGVMGRRMAQALQAHPGFRIVAGFDPAAAEVPGVPRLGSPEAVARYPEVQCVYIATPPALHLADVERVAAAGKAVFCEKPLAASVTEAEACCAAIRAAGVAAGVNFPFSTSFAARRIQQLVAEGALGEVQSARLTLRFARWPRPWQVDAAGWLAGPQQGGFTREVGSHFLFLAGRLFGPGAVIEAASLRRGGHRGSARRHAALRWAAAADRRRGGRQRRRLQPIRGGGQRRHGGRDRLAAAGLARRVVRAPRWTAGPARCTGPTAGRRPRPWPGDTRGSVRGGAPGRGPPGRPRLTCVRPSARPRPRADRHRGPGSGPR
jgi:hypothetical protein